MEHTDEEEFAIDTIGARDASLVTDTVYVPPTSGEDGGEVWNVNDCTIFSTVMDIESDVD